MADVIATLPDGRELHFPEGTDPGVVQGTVKKVLGQVGTSNPKLAARAQQEFPKYDELVKAQNFSQPIAQGVRPFSAPLALEAGAKTAEMAPGGPIVKAIAGAGVGASTYLGLDQLLQKLSGHEPSIGDSAAQLAINETIGRSGDVLAKLFRGKVSPSLEQLKGLSPTVGQALQHEDIGQNFLGKTSAFIENMFAPGAKANAQLRSGKLAEGLVDQEVAKGSPGIDFSSPVKFAGKTQENLLATQAAYQNESNRQAETARLIAKTNTQQIVPPNVQATYQRLGMPVPPNVGRTVEGPIQHTTLLEAAHQIVQDQSKLLNGPVEDDKRIGNIAHKLVSNANARFDPANGKLISADPMSFSEAWEVKQSFDKYFDKDPNLRPFAKALNQDIENSIGGWKVGNQQAQKAFQNAKATVQERINTFQPEDSKLNLSKVIDSTDDFSPTLRAILEDSTKTQKVLNTGAVQFPSGVFYSNNARQDLAGYNLKQLWWDSSDYSSDKGISVNAKQMLSRFNDPANLDKNKQLYSSQTRANIDQLLKNIALTQEKSGGSASWLPKITAIRSGLAIAPALVSGITGSVEHGLQVAGVELGAAAIGKLMTNQDVARAVINVAGGQALGMSDTLFNRKLAAALQGAAITLINQEGKRQKGTIDRDGKFQKGDQ